MSDEQRGNLESEPTIENGDAVRRFVGLRANARTSAQDYERCPRFGLMRCPICKRRTSTDAEWFGRLHPSSGALGHLDLRWRSPAHFLASCRGGCGRRFWFSAIWEKSDLSDLRVTPLDCLGSVAATNAPAPVRYYLDEAARCRWGEARSAATAMFRSALEHLLFEQGYKKGMLAGKLADLTKDQEGGGGPDWVRAVSVQELTILKDLGNAAVHANDGGLAPQDELDNRTLDLVEEVFEHLQDLVYEQPLKLRERERRLTERAEAVKARRA